MRRDVFQAIADPTRRAIIHLVAQRPMTLNNLSANFKISRPAISKQVRILKECGLVTIRPSGRERICESRLGQLHTVSNWVAQYRQFWNSKLDSLGNYLEGTSGKARVRKKQAKRKGNR